MKPHDPSKHKQMLALTVALSLLVTCAVSGAGAGAAGAAASSPSRPSAVQVIRVSSHAFSWGDAGIGVAAGVGISMLAVGGGLFFTSARHDIAKATRATARDER